MSAAKKLNDITGEIVDASLKVHKTMGPGLYEKVYEAQILTYMRLSHINTGLLINFNVKLIKDGIQRFVI